MKRIPIDLKKHKLPLGDVMVIRERCKGCKFCVEFCPKDVLEESNEFNKKGYHYPVVAKEKENECIACKFCEFICPDFAIFIKENTKEVTANNIKYKENGKQ